MFLLSDNPSSVNRGSGSIIMKKIYVYHPFLFAIHPLLFLLFVNISELSLSQMFTGVLVLICTALCLLLVWFLLKDIRKAGAIISLAVILMLSYGYLYDALYGKSLGFLTDHLDLVLLLLWLVIFIAGVRATVRTKKPLIYLTRFLNFISAVLVICLLYMIITYMKKEPISLKENRCASFLDKSGARSAIRKDLPDIFYIVPDGYSRSDLLKELYGYDNSEITGYLKKKGFFVADRSAANYMRTILSVGSAMNMQYIQDCVTVKNNDTRDILQLKPLLENACIMQYLKQYGYKTATMTSEYHHMDIKNFDRHLEPTVALSQFAVVLISRTPFPSLVKILGLENRFSLYELRRSRILYQLDNIQEVLDKDTPQFVFMHIMAPHPPFVFDEKGGKLNPSRQFSNYDGSDYLKLPHSSREEYMRGYLGQLKFLNGKLRDAIDKIFARETRPFVIVIQADHGAGSHVDFESEKKSNLKSRFSILTAVYFSGKDHSDLYNGITPINIFRLVLNRYFNENIKLIEDRSFYTSESMPYRFVDVTKEIR